MAAMAQTDAIKQYVDTYSEIAINEMMRTGVPAAITLAQGIVESQAGQSDLVKSSNNHFGIKCKDEWTGDCVYHDDDLKNECFRVYGSAEESFRDHSNFLKSRPYYTDLFTIDPANYKAWAKGLKKAGYATERNYPEMLVKMIEANGLQQYTLIALERIKNGETVADNSKNDNSENGQPGKTTASISGSDDNSASTESHLQKAIDKQFNPASEGKNAYNDGAADSYPDGVFTINSKKVIYAPAGMSLLALASNYNISLRLLLEYNEMGKVDILDANKLIFLERKLTKSEKEYHISATGETMEDIAQEEGVRLEALLKYNNIKKGIALAAGKRVYLRPQDQTPPKKKKKKH